MTAPTEICPHCREPIRHRFLQPNELVLYCPHRQTMATSTDDGASWQTREMDQESFRWLMRMAAMTVLAAVGAAVIEGDSA